MQFYENLQIYGISIDNSGFPSALFIYLMHLDLMDSIFRVVIGYDEGTIMVKLGREVPVASMDNSGKIIWSKHNEIQTVNIKSVGADYEVGICSD